jgi:hypothetical protein
MKLQTVSSIFLCTLLWSPSSFAHSYTVLQLTDNDYQDVLPLISDSGHVLWQSNPVEKEFLTDLSYWDGTNAFRLFSGLDWDDNDEPVMNAGGKAVWDGRTSDGRFGEGYLWDGVSVVRLAGNEFSDRDVMINNTGLVVWSGFDGSDYEIFLRDGSEVRQLTDNGFNDLKPQINAAGQVAWIGYDGFDDEVFFWDGSAVRQLTHNSFPDFQARINASGQVAWQCFDGDTEICFWNGSSVIQVTDNYFHDSWAIDSESPDSLQISDRGQILWLADAADGEALYLWDGKSVRLLSENTFGYLPDMNVEGQATWFGAGASGKGIYFWNGSAAVLISRDGASPKINPGGKVVWHAHDGTDFEIFVWDGSTVIQLTDNDYHDFYAQINAAGEIVWQGAVKPANREIFLATPSLDREQSDGKDDGQGDVLIASDGSQLF